MGDLERLDISNRIALNPGRRAELGQLFTPADVAHFMAEMLSVKNPPSELRVLDAGGGNGVLTVAAVAELCGRPAARRPAAIHTTIWEIDALLGEDIARTFEHCRSVCREAGMRFTGELFQRNFILDAVDLVHGRGFSVAGLGRLEKRRLEQGA